MNWFGLGAAGAASLFALLVPLLVLYFLKLRRPRQEWPSLALWRQVLNDQRVNSPFQRFRKNILLWLQLIALGSLIFAAMQPYVRSPDLQTKNTPIIIDCSASMSASEGRDGRSRLDEAKKRIREVIENLLSDQRICLIAADHRGRRLTDFTDNKRVLLRALDELQITHTASNLEESLRLAQAQTRLTTVDKVLLYTDGNVPAKIDFELPFPLSVQRVGQTEPNFGITELSAQRRDEGWEVFGQVEASASAKGLTEISLWKGNEPLGKELVEVPAGGVKRVSFQFVSNDASTLEMRLRPDSFDAMPLDNLAFLALPAQRNVKVYCDLDLTSFRQALTVMNRLDLYPRPGEAVPTTYDLAITRSSDTTVEAMVSLIVGGVPKELAGKILVEQQAAEITDWLKASPLLQHVGLGNVQISQSPALTEGMTEKEIEGTGYEVLIYGVKGPLVLQQLGNPRMRYHFLFDLDYSTLPYRVGFPVLVSNAVEIAARQAGLLEARGLSTGVFPPWPGAEPGASTVVVLPDRTTYEITADEKGVVRGVSAPLAGRYELTVNNETIGTRGASLLSAAESSLSSIDNIQFKEVTVGANAVAPKNDQPLWRWFVWIGFFVVLVEWWWFQRRPT